MKVDLRIATIVTAQKVEGADKLLQIQLDIGGVQQKCICRDIEGVSAGKIGGTKSGVRGKSQAAQDEVRHFGRHDIGGRSGRRQCVCSFAG